jgi:hypothetical protein
VEAAALLVLDEDGLASVVCLPARTQVRVPFPSIPLRRILDVGWRGGAIAVGWAADAKDAGAGVRAHAVDELVMLSPDRAPRRLSANVRTARFSPDGSALAYEVSQARHGVEALPSSYVLDLTTQHLTELSAFANPLWEPDGRHLRGTQLRIDREDGRTSGGRVTSLRARWDRAADTMTFDGRGAAQIPAPAGGAVAWVGEQQHAGVPGRCAVFLKPQGGIRHSMLGPLCLGIADDRAARWSPNGLWLAFPHPGPVPGGRDPSAFFVDVVGPEGGRFPALSKLQAQARAEALGIALGPDSVWFDWSPSGRFLAVQDGTSNVTVYDFEAHRLAWAGKGQQPTWSAGGAYLLTLLVGRGESTTAEALVLTGVDTKISLGQVRDARWLPSQACTQAQR